jgi:exodeoxyribonuclease V gamma subunit
VPVAELLDTVDATVRLPNGSPARQQVVVDHPLQPFDPRNFTRGELCQGDAWSYDRVHLAGSRAFANQRPANPWLPGPIQPLQEPVVQLDDLVRFVQHPVQAFLRRRLGLYLSDRTDELQDALPIDLDSLEQWGVGDRLLQACLAGADPERAAAAERARGLLPPGGLADKVLRDIQQEVDRLAAAIAGLGWQSGPADSLDIHLDLPDGRGLIGTVPDCRANTVLVCTYSRLAPKHRLGAWVRFLAVSAARPELDIAVITVGRGRTANQPSQAARLGSLAASPAERRRRALHELAIVLDLYDRGLRAPLPLACKTSAAWAESRHGGKDEYDAGRIAGGEWADGNFPERNDAEHRYVWGTPCDFERLTEQPPAADEHGSGWPASETSRFGTLACRLWYPLLAHEHLGPAI